MSYLSNGELRTKFIKPVYLKQTVKPRGKVLDVKQGLNGATIYTLDVWCEDENGVKVTEGAAKVVVGG
jgi:3-hydroxybutyryl-CoA dehydratase